MNTPHRRAIWSLHLENVALSHELKQARRRITRLEKQSRCCYCGYPCPTGHRVCRAHTDLLQLDKDDAA